MLDPLFNVICHTVIKFKLYSRIFLTEFFHTDCQRTAPYSFCSADPDRSANHIFLIGKGMFQLVCQLYDSFCLLFEQKPFVCQCNRAFPPDQQCSSIFSPLNVSAATLESGSCIYFFTIGSVHTLWYRFPILRQPQWYGFHCGC